MQKKALEDRSPRNPYDFITILEKKKKKDAEATPPVSLAPSAPSASSVSSPPPSVPC